jgi:hypothetical protein
MKVLLVGCAAGRGKAPPREGVQCVEVPMYHKGKFRKYQMEKFWTSVFEATRKGGAVAIHCNRCFHRGPMLIASILIFAGFDYDAAFKLLVEHRTIYAGHVTPWDQWPENQRDDHHAADLCEAHNFLRTLVAKPANYAQTGNEKKQSIEKSIIEPLVD